MNEGLDDGKIGEGKLGAKVRAGEGGPFSPDAMEPAGEAAEPQPIGLGFGIEASASMFRKKGEEKGEGSRAPVSPGPRIFLIGFYFDSWQRGALLIADRGDDGKLGGGAVGEELVLFKDGFFGPSSGAIEFDDIFRALVGSKAIYAVYIAGIRTQAAVGHYAVGRLHRLQDEGGGKGVERAADVPGIISRVDWLLAQTSASLWASSSQRSVFVSMSFRTSL